MRLLLVEDDIYLQKSLLIALKQKGYTLSCVNSGKEAIVSAEWDSIDLVILDLGLPDIDGLEVLKKIKSFNSTMPVLLLTARDKISDRVKGLDSGADDYLVKPFNVDELVARLRVLERRVSQQSGLTIDNSGVCLDSKGHTATLDGQIMDLPKKEFLLLKALMESLGRVLTKDSLEAKVYDMGEEALSNSIEVHMHHLRKKLPKNFIKTIRGVGYTIPKI